MADTAARLALVAKRYEVLRFSIAVIGIDLTGVDMGMQVRLQRGTPGPPLIAIGTVTTAAAEGLKLDSVTVSDGVPTSIITGRINQSTMSDAAKVPFAGEVGADTVLAYAIRWTLGGDARNRIEGDFIVGDSAYGSDDSPANRPMDYGGSARLRGGGSTAALSFGDQLIQVSIAGADIIAPYASSARADAALAGAAAQSAEISAAVAEEFSGPAYETIQAGENATLPGHFFRVPIAGTHPLDYTRYQRTSSGSTVAANLATTPALASGDPDKGAGLVGFGPATVRDALRGNYADPAALLASTDSWRPGERITTKSGHAYQVVDQDEMVSTAGGTKLRFEFPQKELPLSALGVNPANAEAAKVNNIIERCGSENGTLIIDQEYVVDDTIFTRCNMKGAGPASRFKLKDYLTDGDVASHNLAICDRAVILDGITFDANRHKQSWKPIGSSNYALLVTRGGAIVSKCTTTGGTGNGAGTPTKTGSDRITYHLHHSFDNGKKGLHSGDIDGMDIIGGAFHDNEFDSGIGLHQGAENVTIAFPNLYRNGTFGGHIGNSFVDRPGSRNVQVIGVRTWGNTRAGLLLSGAGTNFETLRVDTSVIGGWIEDTLLVSEATGVSIDGTTMWGCLLDINNAKDVFVNAAKLLGPAPAEAIRARIRGITSGGTTETTCENIHIANAILDMNGIVEGIDCTNMTSGSIIDPVRVGGLDTANLVRLRQNERDIRLRVNGRTRLGSYTGVTNGVHDSGGVRTVYSASAAAPTVGTWRQWDRLVPQARSIDANGLMLAARTASVAGSPGFWLPEFQHTTSQAA